MPPVPVHFQDWRTEMKYLAFPHPEAELPQAFAHWQDLLVEMKRHRAFLQHEAALMVQTRRSFLLFV